MTSEIPTWYGLVLLSLAAFRTYRLIGRDTILDPVRKWAVGLPSNWQEGQPVPADYREKLAVFLECGWCSGFWNALAWWGLWLISHTWATWAAVPWALAAIVALVEKNAD